MENARRDQQLLTGSGLIDLPADFEFNLSVDHHDHFIGGVHEILPSLTGRICPQVATKAALGPARFDLCPIHNPIMSARVVIR